MQDYRRNPLIIVVGVLFFIVVIDWFSYFVGETLKAHETVRKIDELTYRINSRS